jgi:glycosyltransferase involved in cell wall biosynthesis
MHKLVNCTLVVPVFNESNRWSTEYWEEIVRLPISRIIFVNDGSTDNSLSLINQISSEKCELINLTRNAGKAEALRIGFQHALATSIGDSAVGFIDSDGAFEISDLIRIIELVKNAYTLQTFNAVWGSRVTLLGTQIQRSAIRHYIGRIITTILSSGTNIFPYDSQCGLKFYIMNQSDQKILSKEFKTRWFYDLEIWLRLRNNATKNGCDYLVQEVPVNYWKDVKGSKIKGVEMIRVASDVLTIRKMLKRHSSSSVHV